MQPKYNLRKHIHHLRDQSGHSLRWIYRQLRMYYGIPMSTVYFDMKIVEDSETTIPWHRLMAYAHFLELDWQDLYNRKQNTRLGPTAWELIDQQPATLTPTNS